MPEPSDTDELSLVSEVTRAIASSVGVDGALRAAGKLLARSEPWSRLGLLVLHGAQLSHRELDKGGGLHYRPAIEGEEAERWRRLLEEARTAGLLTPGEAPGIILLPLIADDDLIGGLEVELIARPAELERRLLRTLRLLSDCLAIGVRHANVVERLELERHEHAEARRHLLRNNRLEILGELAAGTAHEFNNLISAIMGRAELLRRAVVEPVATRSIEVIEQAAHDGSSLVRRIRDLVQSDASPAPRAVALSTVMRDAVERARTRIEARAPGARIEVAVDDRETKPISGDSGELRQVLTNLLYNAIDAMPQGGALTVRTGTTEDRRECWFEVVDSGAGMDPETQRRMFEPFFTTKGDAGTGLGLSVSRSIVERHQGRFEVESRPGQGTRVRVVFPSFRDADPAKPFRRPSVPSTVPGPALAPSPNLPTRARILVIDDDEAVRDVLTEILRTDDHQVVAAATGGEGMAAFRAGRFDLVFTDLGMPDMNGWEVATQIRAERPGTRVGIITGWDAGVDEEKMRALGVEVLIAKPFRFQQVLDAVAAAMSRSERGTN